MRVAMTGTLSLSPPQPCVGRYLFQGFYVGKAGSFNPAASFNVTVANSLVGLHLSM